MAIIRTITSEGGYDTLFIQGKNRNLDIGLRVHLEANQTLTIKQLVVENTFLPLVKSGNGKLSIGRLQIKNFGGDGINLQGNGLQIDQLIIRNHTPTRPYHSLRLSTKPTEATIRAALLASKQQVYDWRLLQWLETIENGQTVFYSPGYHNDIALQAYRPKRQVMVSARLFAEGAKGSPAFVGTPAQIPQHIDSTQIQALAVSLFPSVLDALSGAQTRAAVGPSSSSVSRFLDLVADTPHSLEIDTNNRISAIDLHVPVNTPSSTQTAPNDPEDLLGISDVTIQELDILSSDPNAQLFMLSEQQRYQNFKIGTKKISINCRYPWWFVANTLENSVLGNASNVQINKGQAKSAKVRIGDGKDSSRYCIKPSSCSTDEVVLVGLGKTGHAVPSNVSIT
ncbi:MAG: hypothetical protein WBP46_12035 [Thiolinea sp.]